jgi:hypothetical protein
MIILLHKFDFSPAVENSASWRLPRVHPRTSALYTRRRMFLRGCLHVKRRTGFDQGKGVESIGKVIECVTLIFTKMIVTSMTFICS